MARENLNEAFLKCLQKIEFIVKWNMPLLPQIVGTWNWYVSNNKKDNQK
ncbi:MAG: hypothetical protein LBS81_00200 [Endomicrobium sp.]|jgi:hypothetical protein|nr:hypothetical protein [Endomicrobium sp.]